VTATIYEVLGDLRAHSLDERDKGDKFERLVKTYLLNDPEWSARFSNVWMWSEWPDRDGRPDTGIDLVAALRDEDSYAAIQCKFYASGATVSKGDIDSFLSASGGKEFTRRYIFDTAKSWSPNATDTLARQAVPVQRVDIAFLDDSAFDWSQYSWATPEVLVSTGKKALRPHQQSALIDVFDGFRAKERGKLIMACGTGKTYTSLKIAEELVGAGGTVLFLVPSIQLLSQSLREWMANTEVNIRPFAVCSDVRVGRKANTDDADMPPIDLTEPATTDAQTLVARMKVGKHATDRMTVVFSTYQSIDVLHQAQELGLGEFDLIICDEAHRTTGVTLAGGDESAFVRVHDNSYLRARKRLYMTATPRVFGDEVKRKAADAEAILADMADEAAFGPEFHRLGFGDAVEADLLTDYKVLVLAVDEEYVAENFQNAMATGGEIALGDAAKLIGCWNGLAKHYGSAQHESEGGTLKPMKTAVAFAKDIKASKTASTSFPALVDRALQDETGDGPRNRLRVEAAHVDGTMGIHERNTHLAWLKESTPDDVCRILSNARCLSEGVDVPALDAVMFLTPRGSQVDVVQSVGRVMRKSPGKELGYIILPIVVPSGVAPEEALKDNDRYKVVWQVLQALRSHDDRFHAMVNQIELNKRKTNRLVIDNVTPRPEVAAPDALAASEKAGQGSEQLSLDYGFDGFRDAMYARIVQKVGERRYWETWAKDVSDIAQAHITRINGLLADEDSNQAKEFAVFLGGLRGNLNDNITRDEAVEMLAQHLVTRPIFEALFEDHTFGANNPVAQTMELMLASLDEQNLASENARLEKFYDSVRRRVAGVNNAEGKQRILIELYDKFFATAFKKTVDKLGIVYTPVEIVDFILKSADDVLRAEFGQGLTDEGVHILDGFTGTGTFMVRLLQSGLIETHDLARKYANEMHANEILLLAYYIAAVNIETTYADLTGKSEAFPGLILTDTFQSWEPDDRPDLDVFPENNARLEALKKLPITVILGNPPYSAGQESANDNNANEKYPSLDDEIRRTYVETSKADQKKSLYDSYIRAIKWASLRIGERGVVAFVTNGGFIDSNSADGMRKALAQESATMYVFNLRGNARTAGEQRRKEGGNVFRDGGRTTIIVTLLVMNSDKVGPATIHYTDIGDYLSADEKLAQIASYESVLALRSAIVTPNEHGDWINHRSSDFGGFVALDQLFGVVSHGVNTSRDAWVYQSSTATLERGMRACIGAFNREIDRWKVGPAPDKTKKSVAAWVTLDREAISWSDNLLSAVPRGRHSHFQSDRVVTSVYRPFTKQQHYLDPAWNAATGANLSLFPNGLQNRVLYTVGKSSGVPFTPLVVDAAPNFHLTGAGSGGTTFARFHYEQVDSSEMLVFDDGSAEVARGYRRIDNVTDEALRRFQAAYPIETLTKDDIFFYVYGLLHSPTYRETYAADLKKMLPRIPMVSDFGGYADAGRALSDLHLGYESVTPYPLNGLDAEPVGDPYSFYAVGNKKMKFGTASVEQKAAGERYDRSVIQYNDRITLTGIPEDAYRYMLGSRSAIEWIIDRYYVKTDKPSGIVNDPNDWSREVGDPRYILDLLARIVTVSIETNKIVDALPPLDIMEKA
jgi:predicted helicase